MADVHDKTKRSAVMRNIKSKGNKTTEFALIDVLREQGICTLGIPAYEDKLVQGVMAG